MGFKIAVDGPAGAGKSTVAKLAAKKLGYVYIDTGAMYRAMGLFFDRNGQWPRTDKETDELSDKAHIKIVFSGGDQVVLLNDEDVSNEIRTEKAGMSASKISSDPIIREKLVSMQQKLARSCDVVMDGRDIGTVVLPDADLKIFLTADVSVRAKRRYDELKLKGENPDINLIEKDIRARDYADMTREFSPLKRAKDAVILDTSDMTIDEAVDTVIRLRKDRVK